MAANELRITGASSVHCLASTTAKDNLVVDGLINNETTDLVPVRMVSHYG